MPLKIRWPRANQMRIRGSNSGQKKIGWLNLSQVLIC
jgi:hypothetical protein